MQSPLRVLYAIRNFKVSLTFSYKRRKYQLFREIVKKKRVEVTNNGVLFRLFTRNGLVGLLQDRLGWVGWTKSISGKLSG